MSDNSFDLPENSFDPPALQEVTMDDIIDVSIPVAGAPPIPMHQQEKQGAKCCGCFCDFRRAVYIISVIYILFNLMYLAASAGALSIPVDVYDDDEIVVYLHHNLTHAIVLSIISLIAFTCALVGAMKFNKYLVAVNIVWIMINYMLSIILDIKNIEEANNAFANDTNYTPESPNVWWYIVEGIFAILFIYPHVGFIYEVQKGIMSPETYSREMYSCCCTTNRRNNVVRPTGGESKNTSGVLA